eukprot:5190210-Pyramimonas_sp.AAC.1
MGRRGPSSAGWPPPVASPMCSLPPEVLGRVGLCCHGRRGTVPAGRRISSRRLPCPSFRGLVAASACGGWRP